MTRVSVVVPAFNEEAFLPRTLLALDECRSIPEIDLEVVVVDNASTDATAGVARNAGALLVFEPVRGISRARNAGAAASNAPLLVFVDADTVVQRETLAQAVRAMETGRVCVGGARLVGDRPWKGFAIFLVWFWGWASRAGQWPAGSFFFCTRKAFEAVGGFESGVYAGEEIGLAGKLKRWGRKHGQGFLLIQDPPVVTSARKGEMFGSWQLVLQFLVLLVWPRLTRSRRCCWVWYRR